MAFNGDPFYSISAHTSRGSGAGSRLSIISYSNEELIRIGWKVDPCGKGFKWTNPKGKTFYSSKAVQASFHQDDAD